MIKIRAKDKKRYVFKEERDYQILEKIYQLEKYRMSSGDAGMLKLIRTQLKDDWRKPLIEYLDGLAKKYKKQHKK